MIRLLISLYLCLTASSLQAQLTLNSSILPQAGDIYEISTTNSVDSNFRLSGASSIAQTWDFSAFETETFFRDSIEAASSGLSFSNFPNTDILRPVIGNFAGTAYDDISTTEQNRMGAGIEIDLGFFQLDVVSAYDDPLVIQRAPLQLQDSYSDTYDFNFAEHIDSIPFLRQLLDSLVSLPGGISPDSIRLRFQGERTAEVDAFGVLTSYDSTYNVLRQKVTDYSNTSIEVFVDPPIISGFWIDVTSFIPLPIPLSDTTLRYDYLTNGYAQPVYRFTMEGMGPQVSRVEFLGRYENTTAVPPIQPTEFTNFELFPNPASQLITLNWAAIPGQHVHLQLIDLQGGVLRQLQLANQSAYQLDLTSLPAATYLLQLRDEMGRLRAVQKFVKK